jgi:oligopeptide/dipeptide ABC transporter ATP-binding protein
VRFFCTRVAVMYAGRIMETADAEDIFTQPLHPYTRLLLSSIPMIDGRKEKKEVRVNEPEEKSRPGDCRFLSRCEEWSDACNSQPAELKLIKGNHHVRCIKA